LQLSFVHALLSLQLFVVPPQVPLLHWSNSVQALLSLHAVWSGSFGYWQAPLLQVFFVQGLLSLHARPAVALHSPAVHALAVEQGLPSSQVVVSGRSVNVHPLAGAQLSVVQGSLSLQVIALPRH
jgi:hypothetical protein